MDARKENVLMLLRQLESRRKELGMTKQALSQRTGLGSRTVQRVLSGRDAGTTLDTILAIAEALRVKLEPKTAPVYRVKQEQALKKASKLAAMVQGTSALEAQAVPRGELREIKQEIAAKLISGSGRQLWG
jgi:transcriptional regulator with XRE-family HTH domain